MAERTSRQDKPLFTPGPLTTSAGVKQAMLRDLGSRDAEFLRIVVEIRDGLLAVAGVSRDAGYEAIPMQGSGTYSLESVLSSAVPRNGKLLACVNGAYGARLATMAGVHDIETLVLRGTESDPVDPGQVNDALESDPSITHVSVVHCETTSGVMNPIQRIGEVVARHRRVYFVDSMSAFGAVEFDFEACHIDFLVSSANKCIEGVPGFAFVIARRAALAECAGRARTTSLDLHAQWQGLERNGQFRFTPPTHGILAFRQALRELEEEGGVAGRGRRYAANRETLRKGMQALGFREYVPPEHQGIIITSFLYPEHPRFGFDDFYERLNARGFVIYPGKVTDADCFRIGSIGRLFPEDFDELLEAIRAVLSDMGVEAGA